MFSSVFVRLIAFSCAYTRFSVFYCAFFLRFIVVICAFLCYTVGVDPYVTAKGVLMNMLAEQRYQEILAILRREGSVKSAQIRQALGVSGETVRRDLEAMESLGMLRRTHGGAMPAEPGEASAAYTPFYNRQQQNTGHKSQVAQLGGGLHSRGAVHRAGLRHHRAFAGPGDPGAIPPPHRGDQLAGCASGAGRCARDYRDPHRRRIPPGRGRLFLRLCHADFFQS